MKAGLFFNPKKQQEDFIKTHKKLESALRNTNKTPTGILGLDQITNGGLARGRATLLVGGAGAGKSLLALQTLVNGAKLFNEPGIFVAFEESSQRIVANAATFGWDLEELQRRKLFFLDAQPTSDLIQSGNFDLDGLLAMLASKTREMGAKRIVFDAMDIVLSLLAGANAERREIFKLHEWLLNHKFTAIITAKANGDAANERYLSCLQFMVDCAVALNHVVLQGISQRNLRILKYRGSAFEENESPFIIGDGGLEVADSRYIGRSMNLVSSQRISSGVARLDHMLGGGYYRSSSVLITGSPGTAKSTLCGAFAEAACERGERTLFVSFDSDANEMIRNLSSVNIRLQRHVETGLFLTKSARAINGSAEIHLMRIRNLARENKVRCLVIDPVSAMCKSGNESIIHGLAERLIDWVKEERITLVCTSLLESGESAQLEGTPMQISTIADTWIHLNYLVNAGERNRGLSIVKARGTAHSNQVRELVLSNKGVTLADAYLAGGEVLMGTLRWEKERAELDARFEAEKLNQRQRLRLATEEAELAARIKSLQVELENKRAEKLFLDKTAAKTEAELSQNQQRLRALRKADASGRN